MHALSQFIFADFDGTEKIFVYAKGVVINFVRKENIFVLRDIKQFYSKQIDTRAMNVSDLI
jgi:hypothetical protein